MSDHLSARLFTLGVSIIICLASGTVYLYGIYSPQLVKHVGLTASDSATISFSSTIGSSIGGLPAGSLIDHFGPRFAITLASISTLVGYFIVYQLYLHEIGSLVGLCCAMSMVGWGSITAFFATLKASQANFPHHRGAAGAAPVGAYGMSATMFSLITTIWFANNTGGLLKFLSLFCGLTVFVGSFFIHIYLDHHDGEDDQFDSNPELGPKDSSSESTPMISRSSSTFSLQDGQQGHLDHRTIKRKSSLFGPFSFWLGLNPRRESPYTELETTIQSLGHEPTASQSTLNVSTPDGSSQPKANEVVSISKPKSKLNPIDIIKKRLTNPIYLVHYLIVSITSGICQMYIYSIGFIVTAQYNYAHISNEDLPDRDSSIASAQALQVAVISISSFGGRVVSGFCSDYIYKTFKLQRLWIVFVTCFALSLGLFLTIINVNNPRLVTLSSVLIGTSYGLTFGTYPAIIADKFGTRTFSTTWGLICTGTLFTLFFLNKIFGYIYDANVDDTGICPKANGCYQGVFELSFGLCYFIIAVIAVLIWHQQRR